MDSTTQIILALITAAGGAWGLWLKARSDKNTIQIETVLKENAFLNAKVDGLLKKIDALEEQDRTKERIIANMQTEMAVLKTENANKERRITFLEAENANLRKQINEKMV